METVVGVFVSRAGAERAVRNLSSIGISKVSVLTPGASERHLKAVPTTEAEQPGMGKALGGLVGGAVGVAGGIDVASAASAVLSNPATVVIPGIGPVLTMGVVSAVLLAAFGAVVGAKAGDALDQSLAEGLPKDEIFVYKDALKKGRSVVFAFAEGDQQADDARRVLSESGAESVDLARSKVWVGLQKPEKEKYGT